MNTKCELYVRIFTHVICVCFDWDKIFHVVAMADREVETAVICALKGVKYRMGRKNREVKDVLNSSAQSSLR